MNQKFKALSLPVNRLIIKSELKDETDSVTLSQPSQSLGAEKQEAGSDSLIMRTSSSNLFKALCLCLMF